METLGIAYFLHVVGYSNSILAGRSGTRIINQCDLLRDKTINQPTVANEECGRSGIVVHLPGFCIAYTLSLCNQGHDNRDRVTGQMQQRSTSGSNTQLSLAGDER